MTWARLARLIGIALIASQLSGCASAGSTDAVPAPRPIALTVVWLAPSKLVADAAAAIEERDFERAVDLSRKALTMQLSPADRTTALEHLCVAYPLLGSSDRGVESCEALLASAPNDWRALNNLATAHLHAHRILRAIEFYRRALALLQNGSSGLEVGRHVESGRWVRGTDLVTKNLEKALRLLRDASEGDDDPAELEGAPDVA